MADPNRRFQWVTGLTGATSLFSINWVTIALVQLAQAAAGGSRGFVTTALASELAVFGVIAFLQYRFRRAISSRWQMAWSCFASALAIGALATFPSRYTLLPAVISAAFVGTTTTTLRTALRRRFSDDPARAQRFVQAVVYVTLLLQTGTFTLLVYRGEWRWGVGVVAVTLFVEGIYLGRWSLAPIPESEPAPRHPLRWLVKVRPVMWAIAGVGLTFAAYQLLAAKAQAEFVDLGWDEGAASGLTWVLSLGRVVSLTLVAPVGRVASRHMAGALTLCAVMAIGAGGLALLSTHGVGGVWGATLLIVVAFYLFETGMNSQSPIVRTYVTGKSRDAATLTNIVTTLLSYAASEAAGILSWGAAVWIVFGAAVGSGACAVVVRRSKYEKALLDHRSPAPMGAADRRITMRVVRQLDGQLATWLNVGGVEFRRRFGVGDAIALRHEYVAEVEHGVRSGGEAGRYWFDWSTVRFSVALGRPYRYDSRRTRLRVALGGRRARPVAWDHLVMHRPPAESFGRRADGRWVLRSDAAQPQVVTTTRIGLGATAPIVDVDGRVSGWANWDRDPGATCLVLARAVHAVTVGTELPPAAGCEGHWVVALEWLREVRVETTTAYDGPVPALFPFKLANHL